MLDHMLYSVSGKQIMAGLKGTTLDEKANQLLNSLNAMDPVSYTHLQELDIILVEQGIEYAGLHYTFTLNNLKSVESDLNEMLERYLIGYLAEKIYRINYQDIVYIEGFSKEVYLNTQTCQYLCHYKLYELEQLLDKYSFIRINRDVYKRQPIYY